jgi:DNA-binding transcriptional regulator YiaG
VNNWKLLRGTGGVTVYVEGGTEVVATAYGPATSYRSLDKLYDGIATAIARHHQAEMSPEELRFLRKRLGLSQEDLGALGGKKAQVAAKWEKGALPVPAAEAKLLRLTWLQKHAPTEVSHVLMAPPSSGSRHGAGCYSFRFAQGQWRQEHGTQVEETHLSAADAANEVIEIAARQSATVVTADLGASNAPRRTVRSLT